jgi:hypothetical protein
MHNNRRHSDGFSVAASSNGVRYRLVGQPFRRIFLHCMESNGVRVKGQSKSRVEG